MDQCAALNIFPVHYVQCLCHLMLLLLFIQKIINLICENYAS